MKSIFSAVALLTFVGLVLIGCADKSTQPVESSSVSFKKKHRD